MINRFTTPKSMDFKFYTPPVDAVKSTLDTLQQKYDVNYQAAMALDELSIDARSVDAKRAREIEGEWKNKVADITKRANNDYSIMGTDLLKLTADMKKQFKPGQEVAAITSSANAYREGLKTVQAGLAKGDYTAEQAQLWAQEASTAGAVTLDPETGGYSTYTPRTLQKAPDISKKMKELADGVKPRKTKQAIQVPTADGRLTYQEVEIEYLDPKELANTIGYGLMNDPSVAGYYHEIASMKKEDPLKYATKTIGESSLAYAIPRSGLLSSSDITKLETDPIFMAKLNHKFAMGLEGYKHKLKMQEDKAANTSSMSANPLEFSSARNPVNQSMGLIDPYNIKSVDSKAPGFFETFVQAPLKTLWDTGKAAITRGPAAANLEMQQDAKSYATKVGNYINSQPNRDTPEAVWNHTVSSAPEQLKGQNPVVARGIDAKYPNATATQKIGYYNELMKNYRGPDVVGVRKFSSRDQQDAQTDATLSTVNNPNTPMYVLTGNGEVTTISMNDKIREQIRENIQSGKYPAEGLTSGYGGVPIGTVFPMGELGNVIIPSMAPNAIDFNIGPRDFYTGGVGGSFSSPLSVGATDINGKPLSLVTRTELGQNQFGQDAAVLRIYDINKKDANGNPELLTDLKGRPISVQDIEPLFAKTYSDLTNYNKTYQEPHNKEGYSTKK